MEVKIKQGNEMLDATIEMVDGVMVVSPKEKFEPKDGDIVYIKTKGEYIIIYKERKDGIGRYVNLSNDGYLYTDSYGFVCNKVDIEVIRPATEEEKKKLFDKLKEEGYEWESDTKELIKLKWNPKEGEICFAPYFDFPKFVTKQLLWEINGFSTDYYNKGWCFKFKEECQELCNRLNDAINSVKP